MVDNAAMFNVSSNPRRFSVSQIWKQQLDVCKSVFFIYAHSSMSLRVWIFGYHNYDELNMWCQAMWTHFAHKSVKNTFIEVHEFCILSLWPIVSFSSLEEPTTLLSFAARFPILLFHFTWLPNFSVGWTFEPLMAGHRMILCLTYCGCFWAGSEPDANFIDWDLWRSVCNSSVTVKFSICRSVRSASSLLSFIFFSFKPAKNRILICFASESEVISRATNLQ